jgi:putative acetyltransferase
MAVAGMAEIKPSLELLRPIRKEDNAAVAAIIRAVLTEFGCTAPGFAIHDPEVDAIYEAYHQPRSAYFVIEHDGVVIGGAGVAPLKGGEYDTCELQKNYILPEYRGYGYGRVLFDWCMETAKASGFKYCYIETLEHMTAARAIYVRAGFQPLDKPMGATGHYACNRWYMKEL